MTRFAPLAVGLLLAACGSGSPAEQTADKLEDAADQSDPTSAAVLENAADEVRATNDTRALSDPNSTAQQALEKAAEINPTGVGSNVTETTATPAPPPKQAQPNRNGQVQPRPAVVPPNAQ